MKLRIYFVCLEMKEKGPFLIWIIIQQTFFFSISFQQVFPIQNFEQFRAHAFNF